MRVTGIEELSKSRSRVLLDDGSAFVLYKGELRLYHVAAGEEISQKDYGEIVGKVLPKRAKLRAMNLLKNREYTVKQLRDKLEEGGYPEKIIEEALSYVADYHYTDDLRYATAYIFEKESTRSRRRIEQDLLGKGIDREVLERAWQEWEDRGGTQDEQRMIQRLLEKRHFDPETADIREKQRTYAFLMRKGFSGEQARKTVRMGRGNIWGGESDVEGT